MRQISNMPLESEQQPEEPRLMRLTTKLGRMADGGIEVCLTRKELAEMLGSTLFT